jgi:Mg-chelatase subunit ChlD
MRALSLAVLLIPGSALAGSSLTTRGGGTVLEASYEVDIEVRGLFATVEARQRLVAGTHGAVEAEYDFLVPAGAAVTDFEVTMPGEKAQRGVIVTEDGAIAEPSEVIGDDIAILRQVSLGRAPTTDDPGAPAGYRYAVYPIADNGAWITVRWIQPVRLEQGRVVLEMPARRGSELAAASGSVRFASVPGLTAARDVRVGGVAAAAKPGTKPVKWQLAPGDDLVIEAELRTKGDKPVLLADTAAIGKQRGAIAAAIVAPSAAGRTKTARDLVFVVDASRSMRRIDHGGVTSAIRAIALAAPSDTRLQAIRFDRSAVRLFPEWRANGRANRDALIDKVIGMNDANGSDLVAAMTEVAAVVEAGQPTRVVILTDGGVDPALRGTALAMALGDRAEDVDVSSLVVVPEDRIAPRWGVVALADLARQVGGTVRIARADELADRGKRLSAELCDGTAWSGAAIAGAPAIELPAVLAPGAGATAIGWYHGKAPKLQLTMEHDGARVTVKAARAGVDAAPLALGRPGAALDLANDSAEEASPEAIATWEAAARAHGVITVASAALIVDASSKLGRDRRAAIAKGAPYVRLPPPPERDVPPEDPLLFATRLADDPLFALDDDSTIDQTTLGNIFSIELLARLRGCYQQALPRNPNLRGRVTFELVIGDAEVIAASAVGAVEPAFRDCLVASAFKVQIPSAADPDMIRVRYPVDFTVAADKEFVVLGDADSAEPLDPSLLPAVHDDKRVDVSPADDPLGGMPK